MQNFNKKASILIWSIIMSFMLSIIFISLSNKINLNLKQNISITKNSEENLKINENLKKIENIFKEIKDIENIKKINEKLKEIEDLKNISKNLKINLTEKENIFFIKNETLKISILPRTSLNIKVSGDEVLFSSKNKNFEKIEEKNFNTFENKNEIILKTGGNSKINIISDKYIIPSEKYYEIVEFFGKKEVIRKNGYLKIN